MDDRVTAHVFLELAKANDRLAHLEALEKEVPVLSGTSSARLRLSRRITNARNLAQSWAKVYSMTELEATDVQRGLNRLKVELAAGLDKEFPPERTVAWVMRPDQTERTVKVCNNRGGVCKSGYSAKADWSPLTPEDLPAGLVCSQCGTDVLA